MSKKALNQSPSFSRIVIRLVFLIFLFTSVQSVAAHGQDQTLELSNVPVGPYYLSVWSAPATLRAGEIHFDATVIDEQGQYVTDCDVHLQIVSLMLDQDPITLITSQPTDDTNKRHEAQLNLLKTGSYQVIVNVIDPSGLGSEASFNIEITSVPAGAKILLYMSIGFTAVVALELLKRGLILLKLWKPMTVNRLPTR